VGATFRAVPRTGDAERPFANLPGAKSGRWGEGLEKMKECQWLKPVLVEQVEFVEWTPEGTCGIRGSLHSGKIGTRVRSEEGLEGNGPLSRPLTR